MSALSIRLQLASIGILAVACAALARVVMDEIDNPPGGRAGGPPPQVAAPGPSSIVGGKVAAYALPPLQSFVGIIERPLFSPSRRPPATKPEDLGQIDTFALVGVVVDRVHRIQLEPRPHRRHVAACGRNRVLRSDCGIDPEHVRFR